MDKNLRTPLTGAAVAIAVTAIMDATGLTMFSALPLLPLTLVLWRAQGLTRRDMGLSWGPAAGYVPAVLVPVIVVPALAGVACLAGAVHGGPLDWDHITRDVLLGSAFGIPGTLLTEEGFFRGWLWGSLHRAGRGRGVILLVSSLIFMLWHVSAVTLAADFALPAPLIPVFLCNAFLLGMIWGTLRMRTGSTVVPAVCHSLWNGLVYPLFGFASHAGALAVAQPWLYGPETGLAGLVANLVVLRILLGGNGATSWWAGPRPPSA